MITTMRDRPDPDLGDDTVSLKDKFNHAVEYRFKDISQIFMDQLDENEKEMLATAMKLEEFDVALNCLMRAWVEIPYLPAFSCVWDDCADEYEQLQEERWL